MKTFDHIAEFERFYGHFPPPEREFFGFFARDEQAAAQAAAEFGSARRLGGLFFLADIAQKPAITASALFASARIYVQDYASFCCAQTAAKALLTAKSASDPADADNPADSPLQILDMCAAPGGKSIALAALLEASGARFELACNELSRARFFRLREQLGRYGVAARCYSHPAQSLGRKCPARFDLVLLDAPCGSNLHDFSLAKSAREIKQLARAQRAMLRAALACAKPGGIVIYATCSANEIENEAAVEEVAEITGRFDANLAGFAGTDQFTATAEFADTSGCGGFATGAMTDSTALRTDAHATGTSGEISLSGTGGFSASDVVDGFSTTGAGALKAQICRIAPAAHTHGLFIAKIHR